MAGIIFPELKGDNEECKYLNNNLCKIYNERPEFCRVTSNNKEELDAACNKIKEFIKNREDLLWTF